jgi:hypothetical protein
MSSTAVQGQIDRSIHCRTSCGCRAALPCAPATLPLPNGHRHGGSDQPGKSGWPYGSSSPSPFYWPLQPEVWCSPQGSRSGGAPSPSSLYSAAAPRHLRGLVFSEAAVVTIGGLAGGALVAWGLSVMLVELLNGVFDPGLGDRRICRIPGGRSARRRGRTHGCCCARQRSYVTWSVSIAAYGQFEGLNLPVRGKAAWKLAEGDQKYIDVTITELQHEG